MKGPVVPDLAAHFLALLLRRHVENPEAVELLPGVGAGAVGDRGRIGVEVDDEALLGPGQTLNGFTDIDKP